MRESGKQMETVDRIGILGTVLCAGVTLGVESRMQTERPVAKRSASSTSASPSRGRVVEFKPEGTDSWLCTYVSPFFCDAAPTISNPATTRRERRWPSAAAAKESSNDPDSRASGFSVAGSRKKPLEEGLLI